MINNLKETMQTNTVLKIENGGGTPLQQELSDVTAELSKCVTRLHELSARKAKLELRQMVGGQ